ncbi:hypothetical protein TRV_04839 [Trichophyton verrucosum HKI 0517]|uniref:Uncharacterized protein n=1 Tax=Trichophyton verrucosum (strain HKI 0517) TaxID=663202 RepID=D4DCI4_TRIVH|nr:uncharacterized protein TRV_04839 [Trichophyton verrucosum HKI 0517]EFE40445.1 hypothetical protein TRV_04839 [Trichophyton verrucosum HKI 0517]
MLFVLSVAGLLAVFLYYVGRCQADERARAIEYQQRLRKVRPVSSDRVRCWPSRSRLRRRRLLLRLRYPVVEPVAVELPATPSPVSSVASSPFILSPVSSAVSSPFILSPVSSAVSSPFLLSPVSSASSSPFLLSPVSSASSSPFLLSPVDSVVSSPFIVSPVESGVSSPFLSSPLSERSVSSPVPPVELSVRLAALRARVLALSSGPAADHTPLPASAPSRRVARIRQGVPLVVRPTRIPTPVPSRVFSALPLVLERDARPFAETLGPVAATPMDIRNILRAQRLVANVAAEARSSNSLPRKSALRTTTSVENTKRVSFHEAVTVVNVEKWVVPGVHSALN